VRSAELPYGGNLVIFGVSTISSLPPCDRSHASTLPGTSCLSPLEGMFSLSSSSSVISWERGRRMLMVNSMGGKDLT
jgi:hypothetical protein